MQIFQPKAALPPRDALPKPWVYSGGTDGCSTEQILEDYHAGRPILDHVDYLRPRQAADHCAHFALELVARSVLMAVVSGIPAGVAGAVMARNEGLVEALRRGVSVAAQFTLFLSPVALVTSMMSTYVYAGEPVRVPGELVPQGQDVWFQSPQLPAPVSLQAREAANRGEENPSAPTPIADSSDSAPCALANGQYSLVVSRGKTRPMEPTSGLAAEKVNLALRRLKQQGGAGRKEFAAGDLTYRSYGDSSTLRWQEAEQVYQAQFLSPAKSGTPGPPTCLLSVFPRERLERFEHELATEEEGYRMSEGPGAAEQQPVPRQLEA